MSATSNASSPVKFETAALGIRNGLLFFTPGHCHWTRNKTPLFIFVEMYDQDVVVILKMEKTMHCKDENEDFVVISQNVIRHEGSSSWKILYGTSRMRRYYKGMRRRGIRSSMLFTVGKVGMLRHIFRLISYLFSFIFVVKVRSESSGKLMVLIQSLR